MLKKIGQLKKQILTGSLAAVMGLGAMTSTAQAAEHNWRFANLYSRGTAFGEVYGKWLRTSKRCPVAVSP